MTTVTDPRLTEWELAGTLLAYPEFTQGVRLEAALFTDPKAWWAVRAVVETKSSLPTAQLGWLTGQGYAITIDELIALHSLAAYKPRFEDVSALESELRATAARRLALGSLKARLGELEAARTRSQVDHVFEGASQDLLEASLLRNEGVDPTASAIQDRLGKTTESPFFSCGIELLDQHIRGMRAGNIWILAGAYKSRKSTAALNMVVGLLAAGRSVGYIALEDDDASFLKRLKGIHAGVSPDVFDQDLDELNPAQREMVWPQIQRANAWADGVGDRLRIYDHKNKVHDFGNLSQLLWQEKRRYGSDVVFIDYVQVWGEDYEKMTAHAIELQRLAQIHGLCLVEISQFSNDAIKHGSHGKMLSTKGSGTSGATCHVGIEVEYGSATVNGKPIFEIGLWLKLSRFSDRTWVFGQINPVTGKVYHWSKQPLVLERKE